MFKSPTCLPTGYEKFILLSSILKGFNDSWKPSLRSRAQYMFNDNAHPFGNDASCVLRGITASEIMGSAPSPKVVLSHKLLVPNGLFTEVPPDGHLVKWFHF